MIMLFMGLEGSFDWAFSAPTEIEAKLTNASPGIVIATIGFILTWRIATLKPVNFETSDGGDDQDGSRAAIKIFADLPDPRYRNPERPERD